MSHPLLPLSAALLLVVPGVGDPGEPGDDGARVTIHQRIVIRVQRVPQTRSAPLPAMLPPIRWVEKRAPRCVPMISLAAAAVTGSDSVDLVLNGGRRLRARLDDHCPSLAFYAGIYLRPTADGMVCADRDVLLARSGGECRIDRFRRLVPEK